MHITLSRSIYSIVVIFAFLLVEVTNGKGFGRGSSGGFKSGGAGKVSGSRPGMSGSRSGSGMKNAAIGFGAGAVGAMAGYALMSSFSHNYRPGYYPSGYGGGDTCSNNQDFNGTVYGSFRCPLPSVSINAKYCCGDPGEQWCCERSSRRGFGREAGHFAWLLLIVLLIGLILIWIRHRRQQSKEVIMVPMEPPMNEQPQYSASPPQQQPYYQPQPPPQGYPPVSGMHYPGNNYPPQHQMPYPPQQQNPYSSHQQNPYAPQQQSPYPPQQQGPYNPYQVKEGNPPTYDAAVHYPAQQNKSY